MTLLEEYHEFFMGRLTDLPVAKRIVYAIAADLRDRRGIRHEWDRIDRDIQEEILQTLIGITDKQLAQ
jgi:hypothetical protein